MWCLNYGWLLCDGWLILFVIMLFELLFLVCGLWLLLFSWFVWTVIYMRAIIFVFVVWCFGGHWFGKFVIFGWVCCFVVACGDW